MMKPRVLYIDDEEDNLTVFKSSFRRFYDVLVSKSGVDGLKMAMDNDVDVIITDQRMPGMTGVEVLKQLPERIHSIRMILTGYSDVSAVIDAINTGQVYKYITKPWDKDDLKITIDRAIELLGLKRRNETLISELQEANQQLEDAKVSLEETVLQRTRDLMQRNQELYSTQEDLKVKAYQLEERNVELQKINQELSAFAYISSHDLQEPLKKIKTFTSRILESEEGKFSPKGMEYFIKILETSERMHTLIDDLLAFSKVNTGKRELVRADLNLILADVLKELNEVIEDKHAVIEVPHLPFAMVIPFQFNQLLTNILSNALKYTKPALAPHIIIQCSVVKGDRVNSKLANHTREYHHISISDNGIGFGSEYKEKIFDVFQRLHTQSEYSGTGVGLAICKKIMDNHEGIILADGSVNEGATFHIYFPVS